MNNPIIDFYGNKKWINENYNLHRDDGPAIIYCNGDKTWYQDGKIHRVDGPAYIRVNGYQEWWINGHFLNVKSQQEFERYMKLKAFW